MIAEETLKGHIVSVREWSDGFDVKGSTALLIEEDRKQVVVAFRKGMDVPATNRRLQVFGRFGKRWFFADRWEYLTIKPAALVSPRFNGSDYDRDFDDERLTTQLNRVFDLMSDSKWRTLQEISDSTGDPPASISAQLRHLRKKRFGAHTVNKRSRGEREKGLWEYQLVISTIMG